MNNFHNSQANFQSDVLALTEAFEELGNPFLEDSGDLIDLDQSIIMPQEVINNIRNIYSTGEKQYQEYIDKRITSQENAFTATIKRNNLTLFKYAVNPPTQSKSKASCLKQQQTLVTQILLAMQSGRNISKDLFSHESSDLPPSLTKDGRMYHGTKREILDCIVPDSTDTGKPQTTAAVLDGPVVIQSLRPVNSITIEEYIEKVIYPYLCNFLEVNDRVDMVFDIYKKSSIKSAT